MSKTGFVCHCNKELILLSFEQCRGRRISTSDGLADSRGVIERVVAEITSKKLGNTGYI